MLLRKFIVAILLVLSSSCLFADAVQLEFLISGLRDPLTGLPYVGSDLLLYSYYPGTLTPKSLYYNSDKTSVAPNPLQLTNGMAYVYGDGKYKLVLKHNGTTQWTMDNVEFSSIEDFKSKTTDPFGTNLTQTRLNVSDLRAVLGQNLDANGYRVVNMASPVADLDAVNLSYARYLMATAQADIVAIKSDINAIRESLYNIATGGAIVIGTMSTDLNMAGNKIANLATGTAPTDAANVGQMVSLLSSISTTSSKSMEVYTVANSPATFTFPAGVTTVYVTMIGGGGGGGGNSSGLYNGEAGYPGGVVCRAKVVGAPGTQIPVVVGSGGDPGSSSSAGSYGGDSRFGSIVAPGGRGGQFASSSSHATSKGAACAWPCPTMFGVTQWPPNQAAPEFNYGCGGYGGLLYEIRGTVIAAYAPTKGQDGLVIVEW